MMKRDEMDMRPAGPPREIYHLLVFPKKILTKCAICGSIRDHRGDWKRSAPYLERHGELEFSHGLCADCLEKHYPEFANRIPENGIPWNRIPGSGV
jgi:hypothetical protein